MSLSRVKNWTAGEVLTAADLNNEFNNILTNATSLIQPWVGNFDLDGNTLILDGDADTAIDASTDDTIDITIAGADDFRLTANKFEVLSGSQLDLNGSTTILDADADTTLDVSVDDTVLLTTGATGTVELATSDSRTNSVDVPLTITSTTSGTPAAGIGTGILFRAESQDENPSNFGQVQFTANDVGTGTEDTFFSVMCRVAGAALTQVWAWVATGAFTGTFTHANSADRTYTFQNADYTVIGRDTTDTITNKTPGAAPATPTANMLYSDSLVKGWVKFQVDGTIDDDLNVSSITDNAAGNWTVNWATAFATANYAWSGSIKGVLDTTSLPLTLINPYAGTYTTSALNVVALPPASSTPVDPTNGSGGGVTTDSRITVIAIGDQ